MIKAVTGTMKSAKTNKLVDVTQIIGQLGKKYVIFYPACCEKKENYVVSRKNNKQAKAVKIFNIQDMYNYMNNADYILIDEAQFICTSSELNDFMNFLEYCDIQNKFVYLFMLNLDYMSNSFDITQRVLPYCDEIEILHANCELCGKLADRCVRYVDNTLDNDPNSSLILIEGHNTQYKSVCKECYRKITSLNAIK